MRRHCFASRSLAIVLLATPLPSTVFAQAAQPTIRAPSTRAGDASGAIAEASARFGVPELWIRAVIRAESFGDPRAVSPKGAIGLMQVMPTTFATLRPQLRLGLDPFDVHDNIIAGAAYMRLMFDRFGLVGMVGAYNAGPDRWDAYLAGARPLPAETLAYLARLAPVLGFAMPVASSRPVSPPVLSPLEAPLFVALRDDPAALQRIAERQRVLAIIANQPTVVRQTDGQSDNGQAAFGAHHGLHPTGPRAGGEPTTSSRATAAPPIADTLFVSPTPRRSQ